MHYYALTRPAVSAILCGYDTREQVDQAAAYETVLDAEKDYASVLSSAPFHSYRGALWARKNDRTSYKIENGGEEKFSLRSQWFRRYMVICCAFSRLISCSASR